MNTQVKQYINSSKVPLRFDRLREGSLFKIVAEPSRGIRTSKDQAVYKRAYIDRGPLSENGFYATNIATGQAAVLMPFDVVQPVKLVTVG